MNAQDIASKCWEILPEIIREEWQELPTDIDNMVGHDWIRDVLKPGLVRMHKEFTRILKDGDCQPIEITPIIGAQDTIAQTLGMIEIYFTEFE